MAAVFSPFVQTNPGIRLRVSRAAIENALKLAETIVNQKMSQSKLPGVRMQADVGPGTARLEIRRLLIGDFTAPTYHYEPMPPTAAQWTATNGSITIKGAWSAKYNYLVQVSTDGYFIATVSNLTMSTAIEILKAADGRAELSIPNCLVDVDEVKVKFVGSAISKIIHGFRGAIEDAVTTAIRDKVCQLIQSTVVTKVNEKLRSRAASVPFQIRNRSFAVKYNLVEHPKVSQRFLEIPIDGRVVYDGGDVLVNSTLTERDDSDDSMVKLWVSKSVPQSFMNSIYDSGLMNVEINRNATPQFMKGLRTTCRTSECFGSKLPAVNEKFPDSFAVIEVWPLYSPALLFKEDRCYVDFQLGVQIFVEPKSNETMCLLLTVEVQAKLKSVFKRSKLVTSMNFETFQVKLNESRVGEVSSILYFASDIIGSQIQEKVNQELSRNAVDVNNLFPGLTLSDYKLSMDDGIFLISTNATYAPRP